MIKSIGKLTLATILAALVVGVPMKGSADDNTTTPPAATTPAKHKGFYGPLGSVDKSAMTITLNDKHHRVITLTSETTIMRDGKPATLDDAMVGDSVRGVFAASSTDDKLVAKSVAFRAKKAAPAPPPGAAPKPQ